MALMSYCTLLSSLFYYLSILPISHLETPFAISFVSKSKIELKQCLCLLVALCIKYSQGEQNSLFAGVVTVFNVIFWRVF